MGVCFNCILVTYDRSMPITGLLLARAVLDSVIEPLYLRWFLGLFFLRRSLHKCIWTNENGNSATVKLSTLHCALTLILTFAEAQSATIDTRFKNILLALSVEAFRILRKHDCSNFLNFK